jgi:hypothetical protein
MPAATAEATFILFLPLALGPIDLIIVITPFAGTSTELTSRAASSWRTLSPRHHLPHSSSASRFTAGAAGFLNLSQSLVRPER